MPRVDYALAVLAGIDEELSKQNIPKTQCKKNGKGIGFGGGATVNVNLAQMKKANLQQVISDERIKYGFECLSAAILSSSFDVTLDVAAIKSSTSFRSILISLLRNDSLVDIGGRSLLYHEVLALISAIANEPFTTNILMEPLDKSDSSSGNYASWLNKLAMQSKVFVNLHQRSADDNDDAGEIEDAIAIALHIQHAADQLAQGSLVAEAIGMTIYQSNSKSEESNESKLDWKHLEIREYIDCLSSKRFEAIDLCDMITENKVSHKVLQSNGGGSFSYLSSASNHASAARGGRARVVRVASEMSDLTASLPIEHASSIFVRCDESRMDVLKALIIGPEDTPYENGCFEFDILLPADYPNSPPKVLLVTTGNNDTLQLLQ